MNYEFNALSYICTFPIWLFKEPQLYDVFKDPLVQSYRFQKNCKMLDLEAIKDQLKFLEEIWL